MDERLKFIGDYARGKLDVAEHPTTDHLTGGVQIRIVGRHGAT
jgi:hypothetical protein